MDNLWILTEERPKQSVIKKILELYYQDIIKKNYCINEELKIRPIFKEKCFCFKYVIEGVKIEGIEKIIIKIVSGSSSFFDFLVFKQNNEPLENKYENLIMAIEETKTNDDESRNTAVYQRASKFVFIDAYYPKNQYPNLNLYMLYNDELNSREEKKPSDTNIFGTNMLLTIGVKIVGKNVSKWFKKFNSITELINFKNNMKKPPKGNIPITIKYKDKDTLEISGRLSKPEIVGNIGHDPNIGALSLIAKCLRVLNWNKKIIITNHGVTQKYIDKTKGKNKFIYICYILNIKLNDINLPKEIKFPNKYWRYEKKSEKIASILLHIVGEYNGIRGIYQNHAGCERGYFKDRFNKLIPIPKKDMNNVNISIPDLILHDTKTNYIILVEGKQLSTLKYGLIEINEYKSIESQYINLYYPECKIYRCISIFGGNNTTLPHEKVILYVNENGQTIVNPNSPICIINAFKTFGI